jgi:hypothetical protein
VAVMMAGDGQCVADMAALRDQLDVFEVRHCLRRVLDAVLGQQPRPGCGGRSMRQGGGTRRRRPP